MESQWDLEVVSIVAKPPSVLGLLPRLGSHGGILSGSVGGLSTLKSFQMNSSPLTRRASENLDPLRKISYCPQCSEKYNQELVKLVAALADKPLLEAKSDATQQSLPLWLQNATLNINDSVNGVSVPAQNKGHDLILRQKTQELQKKWHEMCLLVHPSFHQGVSSEKITPTPLSVMSLYNAKLLGCQSFQPKSLQPQNLGHALQPNLSTPLAHPLNSVPPTSPPGSPVGTDLVLGRRKPAETAQAKTPKDGLKDLLGNISSEPQNRFLGLQDTVRPAISADVDSFKKLLKGLMEKVWWQTEAVSAIASTITECKMGNGKRRVGGSKGDIWLLFSGPDRIGKKKMTATLSELVCGTSPTLISLGSRRDGDETDLKCRGKTAIDRIAEAVKRNPFSVTMLQDIDEAGMLVQGSIKRAMERGRLADSHGREISLGNAIFILTSNWVPDQFKELSDGGLTFNEEKLISLASGGWQLKISIGENSAGKRSPSWLHNGHEDRATKQMKPSGPGLSFDLNDVANIDDDQLWGSNNSSDLTVEYEEEHVLDRRGSHPISSAALELLGSVDEAITFKPVDFAVIKQNIERTISAKFSATVGDKLSLKLQTEAVDKILSGVWIGKTTIESWVDKVMLPTIHHLKTSLPSLLPPGGKMVAHLELDKESESRSHGDWLPSRISVVPGD